MAKSVSSSTFKPQFPGQHADERIDLVFRNHPIVMRKPLIACLSIMAASEIPLLLLPPEQLTLGFQIFGVGILIALAVGFYYWLGWFYSVFILTDSRLVDIQQKGLFNRRVNELGLDKVQSINYETKGIQAAIFKFGDINIQTFGGVEWSLKSINHPADVHTHLMDATRRVAKAVTYK
jgi:uncharacterized membrane protein YdbT with pleckstrin-like domain